MVRVDIESIVMASGPVPSVVVLRERRPSSESDAPLRALTIQTGAYEAAAIGAGMDQGKAPARPIAHDLLLATVQQLGAKVERVEIRRWDAPVFYADVVLEPDRAVKPNECGAQGEIRIDARPSDAIALATRSNAPIYVEDDVMNRAGSISLQPSENEDAAQQEIERFDEFVQGLSPDDF